MGQKISPISVRLPLSRDWSSRWFASKKDFPTLLIEDHKIRNVISKHYGDNAGIARVIIKRSPQEVSLDILTSKPGILIGRQGKGINDLNALLKKVTVKKVHVNVIEIKKPDLYANLVAASIGNQISRRIAFRRASKQASQRVMQAGAKGVKIIVGGRLNGAEIARSETTALGAMPLSTLKADIDFAIFHASTTFGIIGVKVWIYKGDLKNDNEEVIAGRPII
jgi:small subunit ribosomal protein S3